MAEESRLSSGAGDEADGAHGAGGSVLPYQIPIEYQTHEGIGQSAWPGVWNDRGILRMQRSARLPPVCVKCGGAAEGKPLRCKLKWMEPSGMAASPPIWWVVALVAAQRARVDVWLCEKHWEWRRTHIVGAWMVFFGGVVGMGGAYLLRGREAA